MAQLTSYSSSSSEKKYDVFLSFRGDDTRKGFTSHLYDALKRREIITFMDEVGLKAGNSIAPALLKAVQESWSSIIVFSGNYASSSWCLDELAEIVEQHNESGHEIFPIFYGVDPSDLRYQTGRVAKAFASYEDQSRYKDKTQRWRSALTKVASLSGWDLKNYETESKLIGYIVEDLSEKFKQSHIPEMFFRIDRQEYRSPIVNGEHTVSTNDLNAFKAAYKTWKTPHCEVNVFGDGSGHRLLTQMSRTESCNAQQTSDHTTFSQQTKDGKIVTYQTHSWSSREFSSTTTKETNQKF